MTGQDQEDTEASQAVNRNNWKDSQSAPKKLKMSFKEQRDWETIEEEIAGLEAGVGGTGKGDNWELPAIIPVSMN